MRNDMKKSLISILLLLAILMSAVLLSSCSNTSDVADGSNPTDATGTPDVQEHVHAYQYELINYGMGFALQGKCNAANCAEPSVIVDKGLSPAYDHVAPTCTQSGSSTWSYTKDGQVYTLVLTFQPVADNHSFAEGSCVHCGARCSGNS